MLFECICPYCSKNIEIDPCFPPQPELKGLGERVAYNRRRMEMQKRGKDCFVCPHCRGELVAFSGKLFKYSEVDKDLYNKVFCSFCSKELDFNSCYKELKGSAVGYAFYCKDCGKKNVLRWLVLVIFVIFVILVIIYVSKSVRVVRT